MPVMVDSEGKCVSFNFPSAAEGRVKKMRRAWNRRANRLRVNALPPGRGARVSRRAYGLFRQGVAYAEVSRGGPEARCRRVPGRPSRRPRRIVSPSIGRARACFCLWFSVPEARGHERMNGQEGW